MAERLAQSPRVRLDLGTVQTNILIFDACRQDLSELETKGFDIAGGFAEMRGTGSFISYATTPGAVGYVRSGVATETVKVLRVD